MAMQEMGLKFYCAHDTLRKYMNRWGIG